MRRYLQPCCPQVVSQGPISQGPHTQEISLLQSQISETSIIVKVDKSQELQAGGIVSQIEAQYDKIASRSKAQAEAWYQSRGRPRRGPGDPRPTIPQEAGEERLRAMPHPGPGVARNANWQGMLIGNDDKEDSGLPGMGGG